MYPYNYLQILYHRIGNGYQAADAAFTYLKKFPDNDEMLDNIGWDTKQIIDLNLLSGVYKDTTIKRGWYRLGRLASI
jgi:hypothetical protein